MREEETSLLERFKAKREQWLEWIAGKDAHAIRNQITRMVWEAAVFRVINEARGYAPTDSKGKVQLSGTMHQLINDCFFVSQAAAIRRLVDRGPPGASSAAEGAKGVYSLYGLLADIQRHWHLLTREHILAAEGVPYDFEPIREKANEYSVQQREAVIRAYMEPEELDWRTPARRHEQIDRLTGTSKDRRTRGDSVRPELLQNLIDKLQSACRAVKKYTDMRIAHAAAPGSMATVTSAEINITLGHLWEAHEVICRVVHLVGLHILGTSINSHLAVPQFEQFEYIDRPLVSVANIPKLYDVWQDYDRLNNEWCLTNWDWLEKQS